MRTANRAAEHQAGIDQRADVAVELEGDVQRIARSDRKTASFGMPIEELFSRKQYPKLGVELGHANTYPGGGPA